MPDVPSILRKPAWIRVKAPTSQACGDTRKLLRSLELHTVCEEAACPNIGECWNRGHATVMILGDVCTRACSFCNVKTGKPAAPPDPLEPEHVATLAEVMKLKHIVITSVDRDDLPDGGAAQFARCIESVRARSPGTTIEVLTPDFLRKEGALSIVLSAKPDVFNHNLETVPRLYPSIRPGARYFQSLRVLDDAKRLAPDIFTKSGLMLGFGEGRDEILQVMDDLRVAGVEFLTLGQYLQPTREHAPVVEFITPEVFEELGKIARGKGFLHVASSPLTRSSHHAGDDFEALKAARAARSA